MLRRADATAAAAAAVGAALALNAWSAGSLWRYQLAGYGLGAALALPLLSIVLLRERARRSWRGVLFACVPLGALLLLAELGYRWFGPTPTPPAVVVADPRLGHRLEPGSGGTDAAGFRNDAVRERADVLCVGDSQTWGFLVERRDTYPALLGEQCGLSCYAMANGGYGPVQYRELVRRGLSLQPRLAVVAIYFGNDLLDASAYAGLDAAADLRAPGRRYAPPGNPDLAWSKSPNWAMAWLDAGLGCSRLFDRAAVAVKARLQGGALDAQPGAVPFVDARVGTMLLPAYRVPTVDPANAAVQDGLRITIRCVHDIAAACRDANARCLLLAIPTKEYCYASWRQSAGAALPELAALQAAETAVRQALFAGVRDAPCELVDLAPACIEALAAGRAPWPRNGDGHLNALGHAEAARLLALQWRSR